MINVDFSERLYNACYIKTMNVNMFVWTGQFYCLDNKCSVCDDLYKLISKYYILKFVLSVLAYTTFRHIKL